MSKSLSSSDSCSSGGVLVLDLTESSLDHLFQFSNELEFVSSGLGGIVVFVVEGGAKSSGLVPELLVSGELVLGSLGDGGLGSDALAQVVELVLKSFLLGGQSVKVGGESFLLFVVGLNGVSVGGKEVIIGVLDGLFQGVQQLGNSLKS